MNYSDILASIVHDVKNSLGLVVNYVDEMMLDGSLSEDLQHKASVMKRETTRANNHLIQVLTLYKLENERLVPNIAEHNLYEFLEELVIEEQSFAEVDNIALGIDCDEWLVGYFDGDLVRGVLSSTIGNAKRYTRSRILLSAFEEDDYLVIRVEDDGSGFPEAFLSEEDVGSSTPDGTISKGFTEGRTQLGFYFAENIARIHTNKGRCGSMLLKNNCQLSGGCFELRLP